MINRHASITARSPVFPGNDCPCSIPIGPEYPAPPIADSNAGKSISPVPGSNRPGTSETWKPPITSRFW